MKMIQDEQEKQKNKLKKKIGKRIRRITLIVIKPFLPFIIVIVGIILAVSTVSDALFGKEDDEKVAEKLSSEDYEAQYAEWVDENYEINGYDGYGGYATIIEDGKDLIPTRYVYMANTWIYRNNISFWYEDSSCNLCI